MLRLRLVKGKVADEAAVDSNITAPFSDDNYRTTVLK